MVAQSFAEATVEEMHNGVIRVRGNGGFDGGELSKIGKFIFKLSFGFGCFFGVFISIMTYNDLDSDENNLFYLLETAAFTIIGFTIIGSIFYITVSYGFHIIRVIFGYQKLWWDDFTFDGENIKSSRFKFKASEIAMIKSETKKFPDSDSWHYASIINSKGDEIGRVMVAYRDKKKMVKYLSDLFGTL